MVVLNAYRNWLRDFSTSGSASTAMNYAAFGDDDTTPDVENTTLNNEFARISADSITAIAMGQWKVIATVQDTDTNFDDKIVKEFGLVNATSSGTFACHQVQIPITCPADRTWDLKYEVTFKHL